MEDEITAIVRRIEALLAARSTPADVQQAIEDVFNTYGQIAQIREVLEQLVGVLREHVQHSQAAQQEIKTLLIDAQTVSLTQVRSLDSKVDQLARARNERLRDLQGEVDRLSARVHTLEDAFLDEGQIGLLIQAMHQFAVELEQLKQRAVG